MGRGGGKRELQLDVAGCSVAAVDDRYSDRLRCDHPEVTDSIALGQTLVQEAQRLGRARIVVLAHERLAVGLERTEMSVEATIPGFYRGEADCVVMGAALDEDRACLAKPEQVQRVIELLDDVEVEPAQVDVRSERATVEDASDIAELLSDTFPQYPTPSHDPAYVQEQIQQGVPFRLVREGDELLSCASADLVREARTAELTDCATRPDARGRGLMQTILRDLMDDLREMEYPTAFTLARAAVPGVNVAFARLGFTYCGTMPQSCRIGSGIEDMNVFAVRLKESPTPAAALVR